MSILLFQLSVTGGSILAPVSNSEGGFYSQSQVGGNVGLPGGRQPETLAPGGPIALWATVRVRAVTMVCPTSPFPNNGA